MRGYRGAAALGLAALMAAALEAGAQQRPQSPRIGYVYPAGGQQGTSLEVTVGGQRLAGVSGAYISGQGVQIRVGAYDRPLTPRQVLLLRDRLEEARKRLEAAGGGERLLPGRGGLMTLARLAKEAGITDAELHKLAEFQRSRNDPKKQPNPQIEEKVTLQIQIDPKAPPGQRELRLLTPSGPTNPLRFEVGPITEYSEREPNDRMPGVEIGSALPLIINGQILPGDVDRFSFTARKGARLVVAVRARELMPYLADAVPGWFQPIAVLYDAKGRELAYADDYRFHPDPVLCYQIPEDGAYILEIRDALYRGREDFVYRITLGEVPFVTSIFPLGGRAGAATMVRVQGWNLPQEQVTLNAPEPGVMPVCLRRGNLLSNCVPFVVDTLPECLEQEPNDLPARPQRVTLPLVINGRIQRAGDVDVYRLEGRAGSEIVAEVYARRLNSPLDSALLLTDARGKPLAANDDCEDPGAGLNTHHADSRLQVKLPASGVYYLSVRDVQQKGGAEYTYRLRLSPPRPDFELRLVPSGLGARAGSTIPITVYVLRRDGFSGDIALQLKDAPPGFSLSGGWVPAHQDRVQLTLRVPPVGREEPYRLLLEGRAVIQGREVRHAARPAEEMTQAFAYHHLVPSEEWLISVSPRARFRPSAPATGTLRSRPSPGSPRG